MESKFAPGFYTQEKEQNYEDLDQDGEFPEWLKGSLLRTGPALYELEHQNYNHWYDGLAMLYKFSFDKGKVNFKCRFLESQSYLKAQKTGRVRIKEWATDPCKTIFENVKAYFVPPKITDNGNINILNYGADVLATSETPLPITFDKETLKTLKHIGYEDDLDGEIEPAHVHYDSEGNVYSYILKYSLVSKYQVYRMKAGSRKRETIAEIKTANPSYIHSFGFTERFLVLVEIPYIVSPLEMVFSDKPLIKNYHWKPQLNTKFRVVDLKNGEVRTYEGDPFFLFHHVNTFEEEGRLNIDFIHFPDDHIVNSLYLEELRSNSPTKAAGYLHRAVIDIGQELTSVKKLSDKLIELPRINYEKVNGKNYRYVYGAGNTVEGNWLDDITKIDIQTGEVKTWYAKHCYPSEPVFVASPNSEKEDDGILLSVILNAETKTTCLLALDARTMDEIARATVPEILPFSFHGIYTD